MRSQDLAGKRFGRLLVHARVKIDERVGYHCLCDCGNSKIIRAGDLRSGRSTSCGCYRAESAAQRMTTHGHSVQKIETREFRAWSAMRRRCRDKNHVSYKHYKQRGIKVCKQWQNSFENFLADVGPAPSEHHTLDRFPDKDGNYEPGNVRWATRKEQTWNSSRPRFLEFQGKRLPISEWVRLTGLAHQTIVNRLARGLDISRVLEKR